MGAKDCCNLWVKWNDIKDSDNNDLSKDREILASPDWGKWKANAIRTGSALLRATLKKPYQRFLESALASV
jgi:hypothetical protein